MITLGERKLKITSWARKFHQGAAFEFLAYLEFTLENGWTARISAAENKFAELSFEAMLQSQRLEEFLSKKLDPNEILEDWLDSQPEVLVVLGLEESFGGIHRHARVRLVAMENFKSGIRTP